jgi:hypothetical protein
MTVHTNSAAYIPTPRPGSEMGAWEYNICAQPYVIALMTDGVALRNVVLYKSFDMAVCPRRLQWAMKLSKIKQKWSTSFCALFMFSGPPTTCSWTSCPNYIGSQFDDESIKNCFKKRKLSTSGVGCICAIREGQGGPLLLLRGCSDGTLRDVPGQSSWNVPETRASNHTHQLQWNALLWLSKQLEVTCRQNIGRTQRFWG